MTSARAGDAADLTGFAIYPAGWGDLIVQVGVADVDAPLHPLADADRYAVHWGFEGRSFTVEAVRAGETWSFSAWSRVAGAPADLEQLEDRTYPVQGAVDAGTNVVTMVLSALALEAGTEPRSLMNVSVTAEEIRRVGVESVGPGAHRVAAAFADFAPDTRSGVTVIDLDVACGPTTWAGARPMCRMVEDPTQDVTTLAAALTSPRPLDLTGVFVASDGSNLILEMGIDALEPDTDVTARYGILFDLDGRTVSLSATRAASSWSWDGRFYGEELASLPVAGTVSADRIRFEIPADMVRAAFTGKPMRAFNAWSSATVAGVADVQADTAGTDDTSANSYTLGGPCSGV